MALSLKIMKTEESAQLYFPAVRLHVVTRRLLMCLFQVYEDGTVAQTGGDVTSGW